MFTRPSKLLQAGERGERGEGEEEEGEREGWQILRNGYREGYGGREWKGKEWREGEEMAMVRDGRDRVMEGMGGVGKYEEMYTEKTKCREGRGRKGW